MGDPVDLRKMIADWYRCPVCVYCCAGLSEYASHTAQVHGMDMISFEKKYGRAERSYYGLKWKDYWDWNPSKRD